MFNNSRMYFSYVLKFLISSRMNISRNKAGKEWESDNNVDVNHYRL